MEAFMIGGGVPRNQIAQKLICFGASDVNVFQSTKWCCKKNQGKLCSSFY
jgi:hypothetical protein